MWVQVRQISTTLCTASPTNTIKPKPLVDIGSPYPACLQCTQNRGEAQWQSMGIGSKPPGQAHSSSYRWSLPTGPRGGRICLLWGLVHSASWVGGAHGFTLMAHRPSASSISHLMWQEIPTQCSVSIRTLQNWSKSTSGENSSKTSCISSHCMQIGACPVICTKITTMVLNSVW